MSALQIGGRELRESMNTIFKELENNFGKSNMEHLKKQLVECDRLKDEIMKSAENAILTALKAEYQSVNGL
jgi:vacuolar-type H+-ATPase subunit H